MMDLEVSVPALLKLSNLSLSEILKPKTLVNVFALFVFTNGTHTFTTVNSL